MFFGLFRKKSKSGSGEETAETPRETGPTVSKWAQYGVEKKSEQAWHDMAEDAALRYIKRKGFLKPEFETLYAEKAVLQKLRVETVKDYEIRSMGEPLTKEEKKELGLSPSVKIGKDFVSVLSEKGLEDPVAASRFLAKGPRYAVWRLLEAKHLMARKVTELHLRPLNEKSCCEWSKQGRVGDYASLEHALLKNCDALFCSCIVQNAKLKTREEWEAAQGE